MKNHRSIILVDSITLVSASSTSENIVISGSHAGNTAAIFALERKFKGAIFNDAGVGKDRAGIAGLDFLDEFGVMAAAVSAFSARIGIAVETEQGTISFANVFAQKAGVREGQSAQTAAKLMVDSKDHGTAPGVEFSDIQIRKEVILVSSSGWRIVAIDSNSLVTPENRQDIIMTGSHGGLVGSNPPIKYKVPAAFYNDAGVGKDNAGISRLIALERYGIIGATVHFESARIGDGMETYKNGVVSYINSLAEGLGIHPGMRASTAASLILNSLEENNINQVHC